MPRSIFLSYAGRTVKAPFEGTSVADLQSCFTEQFPHSRSQFVFYVTDPKTQVPYEVSDVADIGDGMEVEVKLCDESGATFGAPSPVAAGAAQAAAIIDVASRDLLERLMIAFKYISAELDPYNAQERIIQECCTLLQCDRASLFLVDQLSGALELSLGKGIDKIIIPKGAGIAGHVATTGEILNVPEPYNDPRFNQQTDKDSGYLTKSILCVPVRDGDGRNIAVLQAINKLNGNTFSSDDQMVLEKLTMLAGISLRNAQLFEDSRTQQDKVQSLLDVIRTMSSNMGLNSIIFTITQRFPAIVEAQACTVYLIDAKRQQLWSVASDSGREFRVPIDAGIAGAVAMTGETINIADCYKDDRFNQEQDKKTGFRTNNMLAMPLKAGMEVVGVMQLINKHLGAFDDADEGMLETFLTIAATHVKASSLALTEASSRTEAEAVFGGATPAKRDPLPQGLGDIGIEEGEEEEEDEEEEDADADNDV